MTGCSPSGKRVRLYLFIFKGPGLARRWLFGSLIDGPNQKFLGSRASKKDGEVFLVSICLRSALSTARQ
jgi:hypothetical protein